MEELIQFERPCVENLARTRASRSARRRLRGGGLYAGKMKKNDQDAGGDRVTIEMSPTIFRRASGFRHKDDIRARAAVRPCAISFGVADARLSAAFRQRPGELSDFRRIAWKTERFVCR